MPSSASSAAMTTTSGPTALTQDAHLHQNYYHNQRYVSSAAHSLKGAYSNEHEELEDDEEEEEEDEDDLYNDDIVHQNHHLQSSDSQAKSQEHLYNQALPDSRQSEDLELEDDLDRNSDSSFSDSVSLSSSPSIPSSDDIDFTLVYALHTFVATVEGQATVAKGDQLTLLDDSNSYWWLIRALKTEVVGYIPAENIETPYERLARLNKHRNVDLSSATPHDHISGPASSLAQTRFSQRIPSAGDPVRSRSPQDRRKGPAPPPMPGPGTFSPPPVAPAPGTGKGKTVAFTAPTYFENSGNEWSDDDEEEDQSAEWDGEGDFEEGEEGFEDEEEDEEDEDEEDDEEHESQDGEPSVAGDPLQAAAGRSKSSADTRTVPNSSEPPDSQQRPFENHLAQEPRQQHRQQQLEQQIQHQIAADSSLSTNVTHPTAEAEEANKATSGWAKLRLVAKASADSLRGSSTISNNKNDGRSQLGKGFSPAQRAMQAESSNSNRVLTPQQQLAQQSNSDHLLISTDASAPQTSPYQPGKSPDDKAKEAADRSDFEQCSSPQKSDLDPQNTTETKKLTLTPDIARDRADPDRPASTPSLGDSSRPGAPIQQRTFSGSSPDSVTNLSRKHIPNGEPFVREDEEPITSTDGHSYDSNNAGSEDAKNGKRASSVRKDHGKKEEELELKKKKSGGLLSGIFGRRRDKKSSTKDSADDGGQRSSLEVDSNFNQRLSPNSHSDLSHSPSSLSPISPTNTDVHIGLSAVSRKARSPTAGSDTSMSDATLRKQQAEAKEGASRHFGITRQPIDTNSAALNNHKTYLQPNSFYSPTAANSSHSPLSSGSSSGPLNNLQSPALSSVQSMTNNPVKIRPGSLIGSPGVAGLDVPILNVLRIFAGDHIDSEATFKTVLLSEQTSTRELIMQSVQRFHLPLENGDQTSMMTSYYLTIKDVLSGEETKVTELQRPLKVFEQLNESLGMNDWMLPSVKRSSVGSMSSIASNLSLNPAISRLAMNDFSDDSAVKFYINRYHPPQQKGSLSPVKLTGLPQQQLVGLSTAPGNKADGKKVDQPSSPTQEVGTVQRSRADSSQTSSPLGGGRAEDFTIGGANHQSMGEEQHRIGPTVLSPSLKFTVRIQIYPNDLPDGLIFDPQSQAIIPKSVLQDRTHPKSSSPCSSNPTSPLMSTGPGLSSLSLAKDQVREKLMMFSKNVNVLEVLEYALEAFGIDEGVVDGGDDVEEKISKRRSNPKIRYGLSVRLPNHLTDTPANLTSRVLDSYPVPPVFKTIARPTKDSRRRSQEGAIMFGSPQDVLASDPIFVLRKVTAQRKAENRNSLNGGIANAVADELGLHAHPSHHSKKGRHKQTHLQRCHSNGSTNHHLVQSGEGARSADQEGVCSPTAAGGEAHQQRLLLSASRNSEQGVDLQLKDHAVIRSRRSGGDEQFRYSYIDPSGAEYDISEAVCAEWSPVTARSSMNQSEDQQQLYHSRKTVRSGSGRLSLSSVTEDGYASAPESPAHATDPDLQSHPNFQGGSQEMEEEEDRAIEALNNRALKVEPSSEGDGSEERRVKILRANDLLAAALDQLAQPQESSAALLGSRQASSRIHHNNSPPHSAPDSERTSGSLTPRGDGRPIESIHERVARVLSKFHSAGTRGPHSGQIKVGPTRVGHQEVLIGGHTNDNHPDNHSSSMGLGSVSVGANSARPVRHPQQVSQGRMVEYSTGPNLMPLSSSTPSNSFNRKVEGGGVGAMTTRVSGTVAGVGGGGVSPQGSSRSNSSYGSNSPPTPITATSPSSYTPISSATRGIGIESRLSHTTVGGGHHEEHHRGNRLRRMGGEGEEDDGLGIEVLMNLIDHAAELEARRQTRLSSPSAVSSSSSAMAIALPPGSGQPSLPRQRGDLKQESSSSWSSGRRRNRTSLLCEVLMGAGGVGKQGASSSSASPSLFGGETLEEADLKLVRRMVSRVEKEDWLAELLVDDDLEVGPEDGEPQQQRRAGGGRSLRLVHKETRDWIEHSLKSVASSTTSSARNLHPQHPQDHPQYRNGIVDEHGCPLPLPIPPQPQQKQQRHDNQPSLMRKTTAGAGNTAADDEGEDVWVGVRLERIEEELDGLVLQLIRLSGGGG